MTGDVINNYDWSGYLKTWSEQLAYCTSEEDLYRKLQKFKYEFNSAYGKLSRKGKQRCMRSFAVCWMHRNAGGVVFGANRKMITAPMEKS